MNRLLAFFLSLVTQVPAFGTPVLTGSISDSNQISPCEGRVGIQIDHSSGYIGHVYRISPAFNIGLKHGDRVLTVDGKEHYNDHIHGEPGTTVKLKIQRKDQILEVEIVRTERWRIKN